MRELTSPTEPAAGEESFKARRALVDVVRDTSREILESEVLDSIERGELSQEQWKEFAEQRYLAALPFERLLEAGIETSRTAGDQTLARTLEMNYRDEKGLSETGEQNPAKSHETWRKDFYQALGVDEQALASSKPIEGTKRYAQTLESIINSGDHVQIAGALLAIEGTIPGEFRKIKEGRDKTFPEAFVDQPGDSPEISQQKAKARLYIDDHITHDATSHYPDLLKALEKYAQDEKELSKIKDAAEQVKIARTGFYLDLQHKIQSQ